MLTYAKLEWLVHHILSFTVRAHTMLRRIQNLNGLSIVFYRSQSVHVRRSEYTQLPTSVGLVQARPNKSEAIHTNQSVTLTVAKVTIDTDRWKVVTEMSIDTNM